LHYSINNFAHKAMYSNFSQGKEKWKNFGNLFIVFLNQWAVPALPVRLPARVTTKWPSRSCRRNANAVEVVALHGRRMGTVKLSPAQAELIRLWADLYLELYFKLRYGPSWRWYWLNWETNQEILI
jgi:hypothetical protein